jgi:hypothetical protein
MTESSVSSPFMTLLRRELPGSVVVKHRDASMIGLPDCSVSWHQRTLWLEFKLINLPRSGVIDVLKIAEASPVQYEMMKKLCRQSFGAFYIIFVKKAKRIKLWVPPGSNRITHLVEFSTIAEVAQYIKDQMGFEDSNNQFA